MVSPISNWTREKLFEEKSILHYFQKSKIKTRNLNNGVPFGHDFGRLERRGWVGLVMIWGKLKRERERARERESERNRRSRLETSTMASLLVAILVSWKGDDGLVWSRFGEN